MLHSGVFKLATCNKVPSVHPSLTVKDTRRLRYAYSYRNYEACPDEAMGPGQLFIAFKPEPESDGSLRVCNDWQTLPTK